MPYVFLYPRSKQRNKSIPDRPRLYRFKGKWSGDMHWGAVEWNPGRFKLNAVPDRYRFQLSMPEFESINGEFDVKKKSWAKNVPVPHRCTDLPTYGELKPGQKRLLETLSTSKTGSQIWKSFSDNQCATFFQVTYALGFVEMEGGLTLADYVKRLVRVGGSEMIGPDPKNPGKKVSVIGWRIHVTFYARYRRSLERALTGHGFKKDSGTAHPTHKRFGYVKSFRQSARGLKLQIVLNRDRSGADVDLDAGVFHKSAPHDIYQKLIKRFPEVKTIFKVE